MDDTPRTPKALVIGLPEDLHDRARTALAGLGVADADLSLAEPGDLVWPDRAASGATAESVLAAVAEGLHVHRRLAASLRDVQVLEQALDQARDGVVITDAEIGSEGPSIRWCNASFAALVGHTSEQLRDRRLLSAAPMQAVRGKLSKALLRDAAWEGEIVHGPVDAPRTMALQISAVRRADGTVSHHVGVLRDVTHHKRVETRLQHLAHHDHLTGLPNRKLLLDRLRQALARARRYDTPVAVLFLDLDGFKAINDNLGHGVGDRVLVEVAQRLTHLVRASDTVCRLGGDEFVVLLPEVSATVNAEGVAGKIIEGISRVMEIDGDEVFVTPSVGLAVWPDHGATVDQLMGRADQAMYAAKHAGKAQFVTWNESLNAESRTRADLVSALAAALDGGELHLDARPIVDVRAGPIALESSLRWTRPGVGPISPATFLPLLAEAGLERRILPWMIRQAGPGIAAAGLSLSLDVRPRWIASEEAISTVLDALMDAGLPPTRLWIEVAEAQLLDMPIALGDRLDALRERGVRVLVDHYGTSHLSVPQLRSLPVDALKVDGALTTHVAQDDALVRGLVTLCQSLGLGVLADGVSAHTQRSALTDLGVRHQAGPLCGRAMPLQEALQTWLKARSTAS